MATIKVLYDSRKFATAIKKVVLVTKKAEADVVNHALRDVAFRAASFTPKSSAAKINNIPTDILAKLASRYLKKTLGRFNKKQLKEMMRRIIKKRKSGIGALRAGWIPAIEQLGGSYRGAKKKFGTSAAAGVALKATEARLSGLISNTIETMSADGRHSAEEIGVAVQGLEEAIRFVTLDREDYARIKIEAALMKVSD